MTPSSLLELAGPKRVQLTRRKGWRMPPNTVKVDRTTRWGNPFNLKHHSHCWTALAYGFKGNPEGRHSASVAMFAEWMRAGRGFEVSECGLYAEMPEGRIPIAQSPAVRAGSPPPLDEVRSELGGKNLACWCPLDKPCHADVLLELANDAACLRALAGRGE